MSMMSFLTMEWYRILCIFCEKELLSRSPSQMFHLAVLPQTYRNLIAELHYFHVI